MNVLVIIPAKLDSTRLPMKNVCELNGKPLVQYSIDYAKASRHNIDIIISSESDSVEKIASNNNIVFDKRPNHLCGDTEVVDVYLYIVAKYNKKSYDYVVGLQPDNPDRDNSLDYCLQYMIDNNYDDLITINQNYKRSGSVRIFKYKYLMDDKVSKRIGCLKDTATDIHYEEDLNKVSQKIIN